MDDVNPRLLWADDDADDFLVSLDFELQEAGFIVSKATTYEAAAALLEIQSGDDGTRNKILLADLILPHSSRSAISSYLGLLLAERAIALGIERVCFLTVIPRTEIDNRYKHLKSRYEAVKFYYFNKLSLLEPRRLERMLSKLRNG